MVPNLAHLKFAKFRTKCEYVETSEWQLLMFSCSPFLELYSLQRCKDGFETTQNSVKGYAHFKILTT